MWLGANRPVAGALAPKPARSEANKALSPLRGGRGSNPSHRGSALRASPPCTTGAVCKQKWDAFSSYELAAKCGHVFRTYLEYCIDIDTVFSDFHCNDMGAMTFFFFYVASIIWGAIRACRNNGVAVGFFPTETFCNIWSHGGTNPTSGGI